MAGQNIDDTHYRRVDRAAGRNLALSLGERLEDFRFLIRDCGSNFTGSFDAVFQAASARILRTAVQAPRMNVTCERLIGTG
jgi:putative transposase